MDTTVQTTKPTHAAESWPDEIVVTAWRDPVVEQMPGAMATGGDEVLVWWVSTLGPTATLAARHLALYAADGDSMWPIDELARTFGVGPSIMLRALDRLVRFGVIDRRRNIVALRLMLSPLTANQRERLPRYLADAYQPS
ncbi:MAG: hypothetical protein CL424_12420 [Acidimicrobiaceae bacterium]|nr:hypothetical protein [Acidimicrobiaceae bacterium]